MAIEDYKIFRPREEALEQRKEEERVKIETEYTPFPTLERYRDDAMERAQLRQATMWRSIKDGLGRMFTRVPGSNLPLVKETLNSEKYRDIKEYAKTFSGAAGEQVKDFALGKGRELKDSLIKKAAAFIEEKRKTKIGKGAEKIYNVWVKSRDALRGFSDKIRELDKITRERMEAKMKEPELTAAREKKVDSEQKLVQLMKLLEELK